MAYAMPATMHVGQNLGDFLFVLKCGNYVSSIGLD